MIEVDLHVHTRYSPDSSINPKTLVDQLHAHPTIRAVAITDHNTVEGYYKAKKLASSYTDILVIPGVEIATADGDLNLLGVAELPPKPWNVEDVVSFARERGGLVIVVHPYRAHGMRSLAKRYSVDAIEVLNGRASSRTNKLAENLAKQMNLPGVAGSDAHEIDELWTVRNEIQAPLEVNGILQAILQGSVRISQARRSIRF